jgi:ubiquinone/menaquinone biosynthesis C-methylase UbiE
MPKKATLKNDYERMVPEFHKGTLTYAEHMTRYICAQKLAANKVVLDIASGSGYGTKLIAENAKKVYGVDVEAAAVAYATENYGAKNIEYLVGDGESIPLPDNAVDLIITLETIEHIKDYKKFISEIKRVLKPDGLALVSTPNDLEFAEGNHFHLHEFQYNELLDLLKADFKNISPYFQATWKFVAVADEATLSKEGQIDTALLNMAPTKNDQFLYFYLLCSNREITEKIEPIAALGEHYSDRELFAERESVNWQLEGNKNTINKLEKYLKKANQQALEMQLERDNLRQQLNEISSSRGYRLVKKLSATKGKNFRHEKKK